MLNKDNLLLLIVGVLVTIVVMQQCNKPVPSELPKVVRDTTWIVKDSLIISKPQVTKTILVDSKDTILNHYIPDTNYAKLVIQYQELVNELLAKNIHEDSIRIDTNGYVKIIDTVQKNIIVGRSSQVNLRYPIIKETVTLPAKKTTQLYVGGTIHAGREINQAGVGALLKTKNDFLFGGSVNINTYGNLQYGVGAYWKIKLRK